MSTWHDYKKASNSMFSLIGTLTTAIKQFRDLGDKTAAIYASLVKASESCSEQILNDDIVPDRQWEQTHKGLRSAIEAAAQLAEAHEDKENMAALYKCLTLATLVSDSFLNHSDGRQNGTLETEKLINKILAPYLRDDEHYISPSFNGHSQ